jgi:hypothetical protein
VALPACLLFFELLLQLFDFVQVLGLLLFEDRNLLEIMRFGLSQQRYPLLLKIVDLALHFLLEPLGLSRLERQLEFLLLHLVLETQYLSIKDSDLFVESLHLRRGVILL